MATPSRKPQQFFREDPSFSWGVIGLPLERPELRKLMIAGWPEDILKGAVPSRTARLE